MVKLYGIAALLYFLKNVQSISMIKQKFVIEFLRMLNTNQISIIGFPALS